MNVSRLRRHALWVSASFAFFLLSHTASATGYYNFGMHWKGALNPQRLGGEPYSNPGFSLSQGAATIGYGDGMFSEPYGVAIGPSGEIYVTDYMEHRVSKFDSSGNFQGWIGTIATSPTGGAAGCIGAAVGTATPGWCTGGTSMSGSGDGTFDNPQGIAVDSSGNLYVADASNYRIEKFNSSGVFQGWIGKIATSPTGGAAGCNGAAVGTFTPGWCKGGTANPGTGDGMLTQPTDVKVDSSGYLYVSDFGRSRISKYNSAGAFQGWIGGINTSPTGGAAGCNGAVTATPGWCTGGTAISGSGNGQLYRPGQVALDSSGNIYVLDSTNYRVVKFNSSGVFQGWIGRVATTPTGGAAGCSSTAVGNITPGWCVGGTAQTGSGDGMLSPSFGLALDSSGNIYVADAANYRIIKYNSSGVYQGWRGRILTSPTGGGTGCAGAAAGTFTPGWCTGGSASISGDGAVNYPEGMVIDSSGNIYVADSTNSRLNKYDTSWTPLGSLQTTKKFFSWHRSVVDSTSGTTEGTLYFPSGVALDLSGNLLVASSYAYRINKYDTSGTSQGWIGKILSSPTGGAAGCSGAAAGTATPGWCTGGAAQSGTGDGALSTPSDMAMDSSGNLYVVDNGNSRIVMYNSSGVFQGWIGKIATSPTGGAAGCNGAAVGTLTPGWCTGGTSAFGTGSGMLNFPQKIALDSSNNLYVADSGNHRVSKYNSSGVFQGWIGKINTSPTGGAAGCNGASVGTFTPGWCTGGTSASGTGNGMMSSPQGIYLDSSGNLYVSDSGNNRINKYNSSGAFQGWIGNIATSPTGGAAGCNGASVGTFTPGWCTGGTAATGTGDGMLSSPQGLTLDTNGNIYVADSGNSRVSKYNSSGAFKGWIGKIATSPTGGGAGCKGAAVGTVTPGWCVGGTSTYGAADGMLYGPTGVALDKFGNLYVADNYNNRLVRYSIQGR